MQDANNDRQASQLNDLGQEISDLNRKLKGNIEIINDRSNQLGERVLTLEDSNVYFKMIADMVKKHNVEKLDKTDFETFLEENKQ